MKKFIDKCFQEVPIKGIIHIGAHELQERKHYLKHGIGKIVWIEANGPLAAKYKERIDSTNEIIINHVIGRYDREDVIFRKSSNNECSSSVFEFSGHKEMYPHVKEKKCEKRMSFTLDYILSIYNINPEDYNMLVLDCEGSELNVLKGAGNYLKTCDYIITEVAFTELWKGGCTFDQIDKCLTNNSCFENRTHTDMFYVRNKK